MGNYEQLKKAIANVIKNNGRQEITGLVLQEVLKNIVSVVGKYSYFAGVATPSLNPGTPDQNIFYIASASGVYSNFGGTELKKGETAIFEWSEGKWKFIPLGLLTKEGTVFNASELYLCAVKGQNGGIVTEKFLNDVVEAVNDSRLMYLENVEPSGFKFKVIVVFAGMDSNAINFNASDTKAHYRIVLDRRTRKATYEVIEINLVQSVNEQTGNVKLDGNNLLAGAFYEKKTIAEKLLELDLKDGDFEHLHNEYNMSNGNYSGRTYTKAEAVAALNSVLSEAQLQNTGLRLVFIDKDTNNPVTYVYHGQRANTAEFAKVENWIFAEGGVSSVNGEQGDVSLHGDNLYIDETGTKTIHEAINEQNTEIANQDANIDAFKQTITNQVNNFPNVTYEGNVNNAPDGEDLTQVKDASGKDVLRFANRGTLNGRGYVILRPNFKMIDGVLKNIIEQKMINEANTIYEVRYDYTIDGIIKMRENCELLIKGGSFCGGNLQGNNTVISSNPQVIFKNDITLSGTFKCKTAFVDWFDTKDLSIAVSLASKLSHSIYLSNKEYVTKHTVVVESSVLYSYQRNGLQKCTIKKDIGFVGDTIVALLGKYPTMLDIDVYGDFSDDYYNSEIVGTKGITNDGITIGRSVNVQNVNTLHCSIGIDIRGYYHTIMNCTTPYNGIGVRFGYKDADVIEKGGTNTFVGNHIHFCQIGFVASDKVNKEDLFGNVFELNKIDAVCDGEVNFWGTYLGEGPNIGLYGDMNKNGTATVICSRITGGGLSTFGLRNEKSYIGTSISSCETIQMPRTYLERCTIDCVNFRFVERGKTFYVDCGLFRGGKHTLINCNTAVGLPWFVTDNAEITSDSSISLNYFYNGVFSSFEEAKKQFGEANIRKAENINPYGYNGICLDSKTRYKFHYKVDNWSPNKIYEFCVLSHRKEDNPKTVITIVGQNMWDSFEYVEDVRLKEMPYTIVDKMSGLVSLDFEKDFVDRGKFRIKYLNRIVKVRKPEGYITLYARKYDDGILKDFNLVVDAIILREISELSYSVENGHPLIPLNYIRDARVKFEDAQGNRLDVKRKGTTIERPTNDVVDGYMYIDTDLLGKPIFKSETSSSKWIDANGKEV